MKSTIFPLIFTVFCLWLTIQLPQSAEVYLAYVFILTVGIIHGANDLSLIKLLGAKESKTFYIYLIFYITIILVMGLLFYSLPPLALCVFIGFSCYHFGEQHFIKKVSSSRPSTKFLFFSYGMLIFGLLFSLQSSDSSEIILELTNVYVPHSWFQFLLVIGVVSTLVATYINRKDFNEHFKYLEELFLLLVFALIFKLASLLWAFSIYFIIWHSIPSLKDQILALYGDFNKISLLKYLKSSLPNWIISVVGLYAIYRFSLFIEIQFITLFFAFLAAITIPHVIVMYFLNKEN